jgi:hypothetical protein
MKATIEVESREEAAQIRAALEDPTVRAFVRVMGTLQALPSDRSRRRVMQYVGDLFDEKSTELEVPEAVAPTPYD